VSISHPNHTTPAWGVLMLYRHVPDPRYRAIVERSVYYLLHQAPRVHGTLAHYDDQLWDDTLIVSVPLLARYGARYGCRECLDLAADEFLAHARRLQDPRTGCWYHGWDASAAREGGFAHMSGAFWARGNGWTALAATELLQFMPLGHPQRKEVITVLDRQLRGLVTWRDPSNLWHTVVTRPDFYLEASGSAAIAAAMLRAARAGWADPGFWSVGLATREAVRERVAADGTLTQVSSGTGVAPSIDVYSRVPTDQIKPYGQGLYLILATAGEAQ
jgi:unsaturated rhamnogalacturonyl hydrolase